MRRRTGGWTTSSPASPRCPASTSTPMRAAASFVTIEGYSTGELGDRLTEIGLMDGVLAANMVFEHAEEEEHTSPTR